MTGVQTCALPICRNKRSNRQSENGLRTAELWATLATRLAGSEYPAESLDAAWKLALLNQFHDILPGSSIGWVYKDSADQYAEVSATVETIKQESFATLTAGAPDMPVVFNATEFSGDAVVELPDSQSVIQSYTDIDGRACGLAPALSVPALGYRPLDGVTMADASKKRIGSTAAATASAVKTTARTLENEFIALTLDDNGGISSLIWKPLNRELVAVGGAFNRLALYEDRPTDWDAWDIDIEYLGSERPLPPPTEITIAAKGALRGEIEIKRSIGVNSQLIQRIRLDAFSPRVDIINRIQWNENRMLLRVLNDASVRSETATYETQYGCVERPTHFNTSWDYARFEVPGHTWALLADQQAGVALMNDGRYGYSCMGSTLGLSLLRSPKEPDPEADMCCHTLTYSLMPFDMTAPANAALTNRLPRVSHPYELVALYARLLNIPLDVYSPVGSKRKGGKLPSEFSVFATPPPVRVEAFKRAEDSDAIIVRLTDSVGRLSGQTNVPLAFSPLLKIKSAALVDGLERPLPDAALTIGKDKTVKVAMDRFAIRALAAR